MEKPSPFAILEGVLAGVAIFLMVLGNVFNIDWLEMPIADEFAPMILALGFFASFMYLLFALLVTLTNRGESDVGDITTANLIATPLMVGNIFTIGSFFDGSEELQMVLLDAGLIIGLFFVFCVSYLWLKEKSDFLEIEDIDFISGTDKDSYPQFFLATLLLGAIYAGFFIPFKILYLVVGYNWTCYPFLAFIFLYAIFLGKGHEIIAFFKKKS